MLKKLAYDTFRNDIINEYKAKLCLLLPECKQIIIDVANDLTNSETDTFTNSSSKITTSALTDITNTKSCQKVECAGVQAHGKQLTNDNKIEIDTLKENLDTKKKTSIQLKKPKGSMCSVEGNNYEKRIHNVIRRCNINNKPFNTQKEDELAGSSSKNDIECNFITEKDIGIEVKKYNTPDWMQCSIKYNKKNKMWKATKKGKNPVECRKMFDELINEINLYDGEIPPFMVKPITHEEWVKLKTETKKWHDVYFDIPSDYISKLYQAKGCNYIQISNGYGLYHLGNEICNFDVPVFHIEQQLRVRTKIHTKKNKKGFCCLSVTIACQPKNMTKLNKSKYTLDDENELPVSLIYKV